MKLAIVPVLLLLLLLPGCLNAAIKYQTPPIVTDVRIEGGRWVVEKCVLETGEPTEPSFNKIDCKTTDLGKVEAGK